MLASQLAEPAFMPARDVEEVLLRAASADLEYGRKLRLDIAAVLERDAAGGTSGGPLQCILNFKGFKALQAHRIAHALWTKGASADQPVALWLQSRASQAWGLDIHPAATIAGGLMLDHGTGVVIGETATIGANCSMLHGVTLGATGKDGFDRHPKLGENVLIGAGAAILGNIQIGDGCKIGCGAVVLKPLPPGVTAVGAPAKIVGGAPKTGADEALRPRVQPVHEPAVDRFSAIDLSLDDAAIPGFACPWTSLEAQSAEKRDQGRAELATFRALYKALEPLGVAEFDASVLFPRITDIMILGR